MGINYRKGGPVMYQAWKAWEKTKPDFPRLVSFVAGWNAAESKVDELNTEVNELRNLVEKIREFANGRITDSVDEPGHKDHMLIDPLELIRLLDEAYDIENNNVEVTELEKKVEALNSADGVRSKAPTGIKAKVWTNSAADLDPKCVWMGEVDFLPEKGSMIVVRKGFCVETVDRSYYDLVRQEVEIHLETIDTRDEYGPCLYKEFRKKKEDSNEEK
jgi:hypothetical protein